MIDINSSTRTIATATVNAEAGKKALDEVSQLVQTMAQVRSSCSVVRGGVGTYFADYLSLDIAVEPSYKVRHAFKRPSNQRQL